MLGIAPESPASDARFVGRILPSQFIRALTKKTLNLLVRSPRLVRMRKPDQLGIKREHLQLAFGVRLVKFAIPNRNVATNNDWLPASLDDDHLHPGCVARRWDEPEPGKQFELAVNGYVLHARRIDPLANSVVILTTRIFKFQALNVDRFASEEVVATTVVEM